MRPIPKRELVDLPDVDGSGVDLVVLESDVRAAIAENESLLPRFAPAWLRLAEEASDMFRRFLVDPMTVDSAEVSAIMHQSVAGGQWRVERYGYDEFAEHRARRLDLFTRIGLVCAAPGEKAPVRALPDAVRTPQFDVVHWRPGMGRLLGWTAGDAIGGPPADRYEPVGNMRAAARLWLERTGSVEGRSVWFGMGDSPVPAYFRIVAVSDPEGRLVEYGADTRQVQFEATHGGAQTLPRLYRLDEIALLLRKSTRTVRRMLHDGRLAGTKVGATWRIPESELERLTRVPYATDRKGAEARRTTAEAEP